MTAVMAVLLRVVRWLRRRRRPDVVTVEPSGGVPAFELERRARAVELFDLVRRREAGAVDAGPVEMSRRMSSTQTRGRRPVLMVNETGGGC